MKSVKFLSLILMCATSSLALILPAIGVVSFPRQLIDPSASHTLQTTSLQPVNAIPQNGVAILPGGSWPPPGSNNTPGLPGPGGFPISAPAPNMDGFPPSLTTNSSSESGGQLPTTTVNKMGMGLWLVLLSTWLLALFVWGIAPSPTPNRR